MSSRRLRDLRESISPQWYDNEATAAAADSVSVTATKTTSSINAALAAGGTIAGTVTAATGGADLTGICVNAFTSNGSLSPAGNTTTAADGTYSITGLSYRQLRCRILDGLWQYRELPHAVVQQRTVTNLGQCRAGHRRYDKSDH